MFRAAPLFLLATTAVQAALVPVEMYTHVWWSGCSDDKTALASVLSSKSNLSSQLNFTLFPVPDPPEDGKHIDPTKCDTSFYPKSVCQCEVHEACAVHVSGCQNGCSGAELDTLASFLGCYVKGNPSDEDNCGPQHLHPCIKSSGLDSTAMTTCIKNPKAYNPVVVEAYQKSKKIQTYPYAVVNGKIQPQGIDATELAKALCKAGADKAC